MQDPFSEISYNVPLWFQLALSARVPREESNPAQEFLTKAQGDFNEFIEKLKALDAKKVEVIIKQLLNHNKINRVLSSSSHFSWRRLKLILSTTSIYKFLTNNFSLCVGSLQGWIKYRAGGSAKT